MTRSLYLSLVLFLLGCIHTALADTHPSLETVDLQLRWHHQFQFAGYYAAVEKGYYQEEGLEVRLHEGDPEHKPIQEVLSGRAQYAESNSEVLLQRLQGKPLVALAVIFQHSPSVLLTLKRSGIRTAHALIGKKVMLLNGKDEADFLTMFKNEDISPAQLNIIPMSYDLEDLIAGRTDAFQAYLTDQPYFLNQRNINYNIINPISYGIDFYSDILFTSESELREHPQRVEALRRATLKGWRYALDHPAEIIDVLINKYHSKNTREQLEFESQQMRDLILPDLIEIGHMNPGRWQHMADTMVKAGLIPPNYSLDGFIYDTTPKHLPRWVAPLLSAALVVIVMALLAAYYLLRLNSRLTEAESRLRIANDNLSTRLAEIESLNQHIREQAARDPTTGLYNRRYLDEMLERELARAKRENYPICLAMIDLDYFKRINDTYGHQAGDLVLFTLGKLLLENAREGDIPCRYGGEEFVLVLPRLAKEISFQRAESWRTAFAKQKIRYGEFEFSCTMSIGLSIFPDNADNVDTLLSKADQALYKAKGAGRNRTEFAE